MPTDTTRLSEVGAERDEVEKRERAPHECAQEHRALYLDVDWPSLRSSSRDGPLSPDVHVDPPADALEVALADLADAPPHAWG